MFSASHDRTVKTFDLSSLSYVETLFGHQDVISSVDALRGETAISAGGRDKTVRYWKIVDESQLVFRGGGRSKIRDVLEGAGVDDEEVANDAEIIVKKQRDLKFVEGSLDCVAMIDETNFLSGGDSG